ncbi:hypothetical protein ARAM_006947 [Aspergillus rambellii]|uniref:DUF676 domain-containing protein n=2 Tax=Aspergillus subgen. Nidulantes TaxID=2720870 RepID=A0A0F8X7A1_9EURO|nr:hypothetical protein AOCH_007131 [Aspergillus ochraceoroseus]KKK19482.1 hypothetical protein ARAM_006947 [Aspergillus rambellii]
MLVTPRLYSASQTRDRAPISFTRSTWPKFYSLSGWQLNPTDAKLASDMLLIRQTGSVRVGEVVRYTLTYTPAVDGVQPSLTALHVKVKNTSAIPLRAAYLHGPYTLYAACYPSSFDPNIKSDLVDADVGPQFEPYLKAGGIWNAIIPITRETSQDRGHVPTSQSHNQQSVTWVIEIVSQVVFSNSASVNFEVLVGRDESSLESLSSSGLLESPKAASLLDHWPPGTRGEQVLATKGVFSDSVQLLVDDTSSLWNTPRLPVLSCEEANKNNKTSRTEFTEPGALNPGITDNSAPVTPSKPRKKIHLVVLTHGLHSNLGADMLYLKESIDAAVQRAKKQHARTDDQAVSMACSQSAKDSDNCDCEDEQVIVRGFPGNAARTERGIQYLGKRLAKYVLLMTYPDQPHLPRKKVKARTFTGPFTSWKGTAGEPSTTSDAFSQTSSNIHPEQLNLDEHYAYQITSISFIGHSLGGLVQTYAIAYIQKYSPEFFDKIRPINFIALATPFLGLSNENPMYVRFALDFGLVGRTGQDLGLSWTAPRVRSGWESIIGGKGEPSKSQSRADARAKPLLRILPCGPAHDVLSKFKHRTVYSNLVNDGIVPLRTSCLLFLDWKGLDRVEKARRENGIVGTMAEWGWAELTGANSKSPKTSRPATDFEVTETTERVTGLVERVSLTAISQQAIDTNSLPSDSLVDNGSSDQAQSPLEGNHTPTNTETHEKSPQIRSSPLSGLFSMFRLRQSAGSGHRQAKILRRSQTLATVSPTGIDPQNGFHDGDCADDYGFQPPPKTTVFESASDLLMPPLPPTEFIVDPASRPRTIFHDRVYYPEDIPPPFTKRRASTFNSFQGGSSTAHPISTDEPLGESGLKVEEKIARAYHRKLSWRKVLVRLEPDAHNNIIVRRMFTNAYGWPVVKHLVDTHFGSTSPISSGEGPAGFMGSITPPTALGSNEDVQGDGGIVKSSPSTCNGVISDHL